MLLTECVYTMVLIRPIFDEIKGEIRIDIVVIILTATKIKPAVLRDMWYTYLKYSEIIDTVTMPPANESIAKRYDSENTLFFVSTSRSFPFILLCCGNLINRYSTNWHSATSVSKRNTIL